MSTVKRGSTEVLVIDKHFRQTFINKLSCDYHNIFYGPERPEEIAVVKFETIIINVISSFENSKNSALKNTVLLKDYKFIKKQFVWLFKLL